ncbi:hypothetical protein G8770_18385 [Aestuariicella hydrocarbonica]|uniref:Uncharacterized protein n=1 Tax=Pseudomaricurvus hydrocarbonicus TaxID=1470433 RepID=A0A9E5T3Y2_9GAMM|nr:hypothetical protein [Aestuariicella hydrocarbonica]NHO67517.1 hypothetical protein [Aestuariicella hydrocarbonica]
MSRACWVLVGSLACTCLAAPVAWSCKPGQGFEPNTELEKAYCQLLGKGADLPSIRDFRRNSPAVQRLLLSRPAARVGLALPAIPNKKPPSPAEAKTVLAEPSNRRPQAEPQFSRDSTVVAAPAPGGSVDSDSCRLFADVIRCAGDEYRLVLNLPNHRLPKGSLSAANRLQLSPIGVEAPPRQQDLYGSYRHYIEKMLSIGLGGSTMSYSKFYYTWEESRAQRQNFVERLAQMFEYLKRDKQTLAVKSRYDHKLPAAISWCQPLSHDLWTCDNKHRNWVYRR